MNLVNPLALALFALAVPIALLYLIRHRPRELPVATDQFWEQVFAEQSYRMAWRRLRDVASLLVQLILLALLVMALAEPIWNSAASEARRVVIVVDRSASMSASDSSPTRLAGPDRGASGGRRVGRDRGGYRALGRLRPDQRPPDPGPGRRVDRDIGRAGQALGGG
jgi:hypothetical protein